MRTVVLMLLVALGLLWSANPPAYITAGAVRCGATRRGAEQVQVWCWSGLVYDATTAKSNSVFYVPMNGSAVENYNYEGDTITWEFTLSDKMRYTVTGNGSPVVAGEL